MVGSIGEHTYPLVEVAHRSNILFLQLFHDEPGPRGYSPIAQPPGAHRISTRPFPPIMQAHHTAGTFALSAADLAPLHRNCVFESDEHVQSHGKLGSELTGHVIRWGRGAVDTAVHKGAFDRMQVYLVRYGAEVHIESDTFDDFSLVHMPLRNGMQLDVDGARLNVTTGQAVFVSPRSSLRLHCLAGSERLLLKVPNDLLHEASSGPEKRTGSWSAGFVLPRALNVQWTLLMHSLLGTLSLPRDVSLNTDWLAHFERSVALFIAGNSSAEPRIDRQHGHTAPPVDRLDKLALADGGRRMEKVLDYMRMRLGAPISLHDLARAGCVSERTLNMLCHRFCGTPPMELLRNMRLDALRSRLLMQPGANITAVAFELGFSHPGRLAAYYKARFEELPSETRGRHH